ncbi:hypothetical protein [Roseisolibacter sp. H3M3-2]|uniref:hypothetical protein n=1 Tax=Roseisolibacter sp. H3M3-2 TaxID=3031323 RepID=UPI0023DC071E|nr:hypothetical protein [Roseisolibacter sp. H3M3-2]MDF1501978.1 hypothetical protein [Roseisolibacter sp. H3M3-2]
MSEPVLRSARPAPRLRRGVVASLAAALTAAAAVAAAPAAARAQSWFTPSFQPPVVSTRDYTIGVSANSGTAAVFQWREGLTQRSHFGVEGGLVDTDGDGGTKLLLGGSYAYQLTRSTGEQPLDVLFTAGAGLSVGDGADVVRLPFGVSVGHRFPLEGGLAITPYVHPRLSLDLYSGTGADGEDTDLSIDFDVGANFELTRQVALRASLVVSGARRSDDVGFGIGLTITPAGLSGARLRR